MELLDKIKNFKLNKNKAKNENAKHLYTFKDIEKMHEIYVLDLHTCLVYYGEVDGDILKSDNAQYISFTLSVKTIDEHKYEIYKLNIQDLDVDKTMYIEDHYFISVIADDISLMLKSLEIRNDYIVDVMSKNIAIVKQSAFDGFPLMGADKIEFNNISFSSSQSYGCMKLDEIYPGRDIHNL